MSRSTFRVLFYLKRNAPKKNGMIPVMPHHGERKGITVQQQAGRGRKKMWNVELGKLTGRSLVAQEGNRMLDKIRLGINKAYQEVCDTDGYVTAEKVRNAYLGLGQNSQDPAGRVQAAKRGLCKAGRQDEERAQLLEILRGI